MSDALLTWDDADDKDRANGYSRYASYLHDRRTQFVEGTALEPVTDGEFAVACWNIANSPIMAPGYIGLRPDIESVRVLHTGNGDRLMAYVTVRIGWPGGLHPLVPPMVGWQRWESDRGWYSEEGVYPWVPPQDESKPALLCTAELCIPIDFDQLPSRGRPAPWTDDPRCKPGEVDVDDAKAVVQWIAGHVNREAGPVVAALR